MSTAIDSLGGQIASSSSREAIIYQSSHFHQAAPLALSLISDTVLNPSFIPDELAAQRDAARYEVREASAKADMILPEILHHVAYDGQTLGNPLLCPEDRIDLITGDLLRKCMEDWYRPERMVVAGIGMQHEELVELTDKYFSSLKSVIAPVLTGHQNASPVPPHLLPSSSPSVYKSLTRAASSYLYPNTSVDPPSVLNSHQFQSTYTGGHRFIHDPKSEFNHLYIAFEGVGIHDDDVYTLATMQILLGGGGSFSAGAIFMPVSFIQFSFIFQAAPGRVCIPVYTLTSSTTSHKSITVLPFITSTPTRHYLVSLPLLCQPFLVSAEATAPHRSCHTWSTSSAYSCIPLCLK
jgi:processing peptidase subunit alpha